MMYLRFVTADGCVCETRTFVDGTTLPRTLERACRAPPSFLGQETPDIREMVTQTRTYYFVRIVRDESLGMAGKMVAVYEEHVPQLRPEVTGAKVTAAKFARVVFDEHYDLEALGIADGKREDVPRVLQIMWDKTKRRSAEAHLERARELFDRIKK